MEQQKQAGLHVAWVRGCSVVEGAWGDPVGETICLETSTELMNPELQTPSTHLAKP